MWRVVVYKIRLPTIGLFFPDEPWGGFATLVGLMEARGRFTTLVCSNREPVKPQATQRTLQKTVDKITVPVKCDFAKHLDPFLPAVNRQPD